MSGRPTHVVPANHIWRHNLVLRSRMEEDRSSERERVRRVEEALVRLADSVEKVEALDELEKDEARDRALCDAVVRSAGGPRRLASCE